MEGSLIVDGAIHRSRGRENENELEEGVGKGKMINEYLQ